MTSELNEKIYSKVFGESNERYNIVQKEKFERIVDLFEPCGRVLDVGCGDGWFGRRIIEDFGADVHGVDISEDALKIAESSGLKVKKQDLDGTELAYPNNHFDAVLCGDIIEHLLNTEFFLKEIRRVLKKNGFLILSVPNIAAYYNRLLLLTGKFPLGIESASELVFPPVKVKELYNTGHVRAYTKETITKLIVYHGFRIENVKGAPMVIHTDYLVDKFKKYLRIANALERFFARFPTLASIILVKARKV
ncbi:MAG: class I SAM-dependent methyltransferase [Candidatus Hodarchaeota archaeon]